MEVLDDLSSVGIVLGTIAFTFCMSLMTFLCLKIKSTKKNPELLGTVGTVKPLEDLEENSIPPSSFKLKSSPRLRPVSTISDVIHDITDASANANRTPSRAGERKLPDIPRGNSFLNSNSEQNNGSDLYATLGSALAGSDSEEAETEPTESHHPYAKVKKVREDHPYATVQQNNVNNSAENSLPNNGNPASVSSIPRPPPEPLVDIRPQPVPDSRGVGGASGGSGGGGGRDPPNQGPQYFSGDSQDSSKGYTSISVREPLRHIRGPNSVPVHNPNNPTNNPNYAPVSETSDDMYAAIEDPTYLPTGNQSNSDTYAVINLPEDDDEEEVELRSAHTYSQVDKSRKRKAMSHQPTTKPPAAPVLNNNVDDMYAKVQKNISPPRRSWNSKKSSTDPAYETVSDPADNLPIGASAMRTSAEHLLGARPRLPPHHRHQINYSDYEVAHYDPNTSKHANVTTTNKNEDQELGYETVPENRSFLQQRSNNDHEGYERVEDYWRSNGSDDAGYELVRGNSKRGGTAGGTSVSGGGGGTSGRSASGFERLTFSSSSKKTGPGYETVPPRPPLPRMNQYHDPPYARLENSKDEEMESEEGYETIPASERQNRNDLRGGGFDPGYESVPDKRGQGSEPGYETVPGREAIHMFRDPGYETLVQNKPDPGYATVVEHGAVVEHGYENLVQPGGQKQDHHKDHHGKPEIKSSSSNSIHTTTSGGGIAAPSSLTSISNSVNVVHMSVRKTQSDPPDQLIVPPPGRPMLSQQQSEAGVASKPPMLLPRNPTTSVVVIEHTSTKMAVNNNVVKEENQNQKVIPETAIQARGQQDGKNNSSAEKQIQSHIFV